MRPCAADVAGTQTAIVIRAPTDNECAILDMAGCLAAGVPSAGSAKCSAYNNLAKPVRARAGKR